MIKYSELLEKNSEADKIDTVMIRILKKCNSHCTFCDFWKSNDEMSIDMIKKIIFGAKNLQVKEICLTGGEPTIHQNFFEIIELIQKSGLIYSFITNGSNLNDEFLKKLMKFPPSKVFISIDSSNEKTHDFLRATPGLFKKAKDGIQKLNKFSNRPKLIINYVISNKSYLDLPKIIELSSDMEFDEINLFNIKKIDNLYLDEMQITEYNSIVVPRFLKILKDYKVVLRNDNPYIFGITRDEIENSTNGDYSSLNYYNKKCFLSKKMIFVECSGEVYPCNNSPYKAKNYVLGNVFENSLENIIKSEQYLKIITSINCKKCSTCDPVNVSFNNTAGGVR